MTATGPRGISERNASSAPNPGEESRRAANGYLIWPLAAANIVREDEATSIWSRIHARQALVMGVLGSLLLFAVLALPLLAVVAFPVMSSETTIAVYGIGLAVDAVVALFLLGFGARCAARAARGDLFSIPLVTPIVDRFFHLERF